MIITWLIPVCVETLLVVKMTFPFKDSKTTKPPRAESSKPFSWDLANFPKITIVLRKPAFFQPSYSHFYSTWGRSREQCAGVWCVEKAPHVQVSDCKSYDWRFVSLTVHAWIQGQQSCQLIEQLVLLLPSVLCSHTRTHFPPFCADPGKDIKTFRSTYISGLNCGGNKDNKHIMLQIFIHL